MVDILPYDSIINNMNKDMEVKVNKKFTQWKEFEGAVIDEINCRLPQLGKAVEWFEGTLYAETHKFSIQQKIKEIILMYAKSNTRVIVSNMPPRAWDDESEFLECAFDVVPAEEPVSDEEFWGLASWEEKQLMTQQENK